MYVRETNGTDNSPKLQWMYTAGMVSHFYLLYRVIEARVEQP